MTSIVPKKNAFETLTGYANGVKSRTAPFDAALKVGINVAKIPKAFNENVLPTGIANVTDHFTKASGLIGVTGLVSRIFEWANRDERKDWSRKKYAAQVGLTAAGGLEVVNWGHSVGLWALGVAATPLSIAYKVILLPVSGVNAWDAGEKIAGAGKPVAKYERRLNKWNERCAGTRDISAEAQAKLKQLDARIQNFGTGSLSEKQNEEKIRLEVRQDELNALKDAVDNGQADDAIKALCERKIEAYTNVVQAAKRNKGKIQTKNWLALVNSIMKFALGVLGLAMLAFALTAPWLLATVAAAWAATHFLGLTKDIYDAQQENKPVKLEDLRSRTLALA